MNITTNSILNSNSLPRSNERLFGSKEASVSIAKQKAHKHLASKYCTIENYVTLNEINRTIVQKQCILKTTFNDIKFNLEEERLQKYLKVQKSQQELPQLIEYYKYYSQKSVIFIKQYFPLLYQYQQKRKVIEYNRLKVLLNLSDSSNPKSQSKNKNINQDSISRFPNKSKIAISRNLLYQKDANIKINGYKGINILDSLQDTKISQNSQSEQSLLINRLRSNLSKHIGPSKTKNQTIQEIDKQFNFTKKNDIFHTIKENNRAFICFNNGKSKTNPLKSTKCSRQQTHTNTPDDLKSPKDNIRKRSAKRNNSCQILIAKVVCQKNPYDSYTNKLRRKKNLSMDNLHTNTSTPYAPQQRRQSSKMKRIQVKTGQKQRYHTHKQKQNLTTKSPDIFLQSISDLKSKIKKEKQKLLKVNNNNGQSIQSYSGSGTNNLTSLKRQKVHCRLLSNGFITTNQRFSKKNYQKLRQKTNYFN